jgi:PKD repeat protein
MRSFHRTLGYMAALSLVVAACGGDDGNGGGGPDENDQPVAAFTPSCTGLACTFTDASTDADSLADITTWSWDFGDDATSTEQSPQHTYAAAGTYTVTLTVTDRAGADNETSEDVTVEVPAENEAPTADFAFCCLSLDCSFDNNSTDPNVSTGDVLTYAWDFGDGNTSTEINPMHTYDVAVADTFEVTLTATDAGGLEDVFSDSVVVAPPAVCTEASCDLTLQDNATVTVTLTSVGCTADGNTLRILEPVDTTLFTDGCHTPAATSFTLVGGTANVFDAGTTIVPEVISGSTELAFPPTLRVQTGTAYPTWILEFDDGESGEDPDECPGDPTCGGREPDFNDLIITITATPQ